MPMASAPLQRPRRSQAIVSVEEEAPPPSLRQVVRREVRGAATGRSRTPRRSSPTSNGSASARGPTRSRSTRCTDRCVDEPDVGRSRVSIVVTAFTRRFCGTANMRAELSQIPRNSADRNGARSCAGGAACATRNLPRPGSGEDLHCVLHEFFAMQQPSYRCC
jgi:hypothetical protein